MPSVTGGAARRVLLVDDDTDVLHSVAAALSRSLGCVIEPFTRGSDALERAAKVAFDVAVLDIDMPTMSGIKVARALRAIQADLPILFLTGSVPQLDQADIDTIAPRAVLAKPVLLSDLSARLLEALDT